MYLRHCDEGAARTACYDVSNIHSQYRVGQCPSGDKWQEVYDILQNTTREIINNRFDPISLICGPGE